MTKGKFKFKTTHATGKWRSFYNSQHNIKIGKMTCGEITEIPKNNLMSNEDKVRIKFQVIKEDINEDGNPNCSWKWVTLKAKFDTVDEAKTYLNSDGVFERINNSFKLYLHED